MDLTLTAEQEALRDTVRAFCADRFPMSAIRASQRIDRARWSELGALGLFGLRATEAVGGSGLSMVEAVLAFMELGRHLVPGPLVATEVAVAAGWEPAADSRIVEIMNTGAPEGTETGPVLVSHLADLDAVYVVAPGAVRRVDPSTLDAAAVTQPLDPLTPLHVVRSQLPEGDDVACDAAVESADLAWRDGALLTAAYLAGVAAAVTDLAVEHAKQRQQFGRPIGGFQAVKHLLADLYVRAEVAASAVLVAASTVAEHTQNPTVADDPWRAVHGARAVAAEAAQRTARGAVQVLGGMGYTWEVDAHLYLKRAWYLDTTFGSAAHHAEALALRCTETVRQELL